MNSENSHPSHSRMSALGNYSEVDADTLLAQFNRLIADVLKGTLNRNTFRPWEIAILLDVEGCELKDGQRREVLKRYQKAVQRSMEKGASQPMKLSEYLEAVSAKRSARENSVLGEVAALNLAQFSAAQIASLEMAGLDDDSEGPLDLGELAETEGAAKR